MTSSGNESVEYLNANEAYCNVCESIIPSAHAMSHAEGNHNE